MKVSKVVVFGHVPMGTMMWLTAAQASSRQFAVTAVETKKKVKDRELFSANQQLGFKAGEELSIEGDLDRGLEIMFGITDADHASQERGRNKARAIAEVEKKIEAAKTALATAEQAEVAEQDPEKKLAAGKVVTQAAAQLEAARAELTALSE